MVISSASKVSHYVNLYGATQRQPERHHPKFCKMTPGCPTSTCTTLNKAKAVWLLCSSLRYHTTLARVASLGSAPCGTISSFMKLLRSVWRRARRRLGGRLVWV